MDFVRIQHNDDIIWINIIVTANGAMNWMYRYTDDGFAHQQSHTGAPPHRHALGFFPEKMGDTDLFQFTLHNYAHDSIQYTLHMEWWQGATKLHTWEQKGEIAPGDNQQPRGGVRFDKG